ncbi:MAG: glycosyltransferase [Prevotellaceae bacterium]|jgi:glycosyltransferase involved in cell wall biosynthesis|nr:glycosyltransferase [Prevotellaceae bacterium]
MKILHINTSDRGGAANACLRLHKGLLSAGVDSKVLVLYKSNNNIPQVFTFEALTIKEKSVSEKIKGKIKYILIKLYLYRNSPNKIKVQRQMLAQSRDYRLEMFSFPESDYDITDSQLFKDADIIHLHWVADFLDYQTFFAKCKKPVVWTFHDQNPMLGIEHYAEWYSAIDNDGFPVKRTISNIERTISDEKFQIKKEALSKFNNLNIVTVCHWMKSECEVSEIYNRFAIFMIHNGLNGNIFQPRNKVFARSLLDIPQDKNIILFVADNISNNRKGYEYLLRALRKINNENVMLCSMGSKNAEIINNKHITEFGNISDERLMSVIYSAADVFVIPSLMDNLPNTVLESLLCGTPVIGFPVGGIKDMVIDGQNGYLTNEISVSALAGTINKFLQNPKIFDTRQIRKDAVERFESSVQAKNVLNLYKKINVHN